MMKSALARIDFMVVNTLNPENLSNSNFFHSEIENLIISIKEAQTEICLYLKEQFFSDLKEKKLELFVQRCQTTIIHFADTLYEYSNLSQDPDIRNAYQKVIKLFEEFLNFIQTRFSAYFNLDAKIPKSYTNICVEENKTQMELFLKNIKKHKIDKNLLTIIIQSFESSYSLTSVNELTFRKLIYLRKLMSALIEKSNSRKIENINTHLLVKFLYFNYNHIRLFNYITKFISAELNELPGNLLVIEKLQWYIKALNQLQVKPQSALFPELPDLKNLCINWMEDEIIFIKNKNQPALIMPPTFESQTNRIETSLTVPQLGLLIKLLIDQGVIKNSSYRHLSKITSQYFKTSNSEKLSAESLRSKTFSFEKQTINKVKDVIIGLLNNVNHLKIHVSILLLNYAFQEMLPALSEYV